MLINPKKIKSENTKLLNEMGISVIDWLPHLDKTKFRNSKEVAERCVVLAALLQIHFGAPNDFIEDYLSSNGLMNSLTANEKERLSRNFDDWSDQEKIDINWSIEAIWALVWIGGKHSNLTFNTFVEDSLASMLPQFQEKEPVDSFIKNFSLLSKKLIFKELDKFYRAHWFARNSSLEGTQNEQVNLSIVMERRKALEWVCDASLDWDDIPLDT